MEMQRKFFIGHTFDPAAATETGEPLLFDPRDLTTHAAVVGMTGSGKTGLCIGLMEEAALQGIPALMIDVKGDIANTLLHFPDLAPQDFQPWLDPDRARREGKTVEELAESTAALWQQGLAKDGISPERLRTLKNSVRFTVFTPGSDAGEPVSILASLKAPSIAWEGNTELLREKISATVTALLGLAGLKDIDPVRSREHILLANIFEHAWSQGRDLDLGELILQTQAPPFAKLGVFEVNVFYPEKERFSLAMSLNNILAAPAFQAWVEGHALDVQSLLYTSLGQPRHSIFYIAHLPEAERMFFITLLFSQVESWMRAQAGANSLRAILYFDEIFGYLPPVANPPSKQPMLRMLKQGRAFGVGLVLVTQNPADIDYKALSNAGAWFIGKLQTDQDKQRLLDGLQGATEGGLNRAEYDRLISTLGKRIFLLHSVHAPRPRLFKTRWAMNFLAGPITRAQIPALNRLAQGEAGTTAPTPGAPVDGAPELPDEFQPIPVVPEDEQAAMPGVGASTTRPALPTGAREYFLPNNLTFTQAFKAAGRAYPPEAYSQGLIYRPVILAQAAIRYLNRKYKLEMEQKQAVILLNPDRRGHTRWDSYLVQPVDPNELDSVPDPHASYTAPQAPFTDAKALSALQKDFVEWAYRSGQVTVRANEALKLFAGPEVSQAEFRKLSSEAARKGRETEIKKAADSFDKKIETIRVRIGREERELAEDQTRLSQRKMEEMGTHAENVFSLFSKRGSTRRLSTSLSKRRLTEQAKAAVDESIAAIADFKRQIAALEEERAQALQNVNERWSEIANQFSEISVTPYKKDVLLELFGVAWMPFHIIKVGDEIEELPGYGKF